jgi:regulator of sigma E protease
METVLRNAGSFIVVLGLVIFVHEFGHFLVAKAFRMRVFIFSFGFGPRLAGFKWGDTDCRLSLIPLGGYVKLEGEPGDRLSEEVSAAGDARDFTARPRWQRFLVYVAGPVMNAALTFVVFTTLFMFEATLDATPFDPPVIGTVKPGSPAEQAGLRAGDLLLSVDGQPLRTWGEADLKVLLHPDKQLAFRVRRGSDEIDVPVRSVSKGPDEAGDIGVTPLVRVGAVRPGEPAEAAGLRKDDGLLRLAGKPVTAWKDISPIAKTVGENPLPVQVFRSGAVVDLTVTPRKGKAANEAEFVIGIDPKEVKRQLGPAAAAAAAGRELVKWTSITFTTIGQLLTGERSVKSMSGPLGIAQASGEAAERGLGSFFTLVAVISLQVGLLNLFPLVPLDGGHLAIIAAEGAWRRDFSPTVKGWIMNAGVALVLLLIGIVLYSDISKTSWFSKP